MAEEERILACARADRPECHIRGSIRMRQCMECGTDLVIAPSGQRELAAHPEMRTICIDCAMRAQEISKVEPVPGAIEEVARDIMATVIEYARKAAKARDN